MGRNEPSAALIARTSVLLMATPIALTPRPNMMAPNPHAKPATHAAITDFVGDSRRTIMKFPAVHQVITTGRATHEMRIKIAQTFSQDHWPINFIGMVKMPHMSPAMSTRVRPRNGDE